MFDFLWNTNVELKPMGQHPQWPKNSECLTSKIKYIEKYIVFKILYRNILILIYGQPVFKVFFHSHMNPNKTMESLLSTSHQAYIPCVIL